MYHLLAYTTAIGAVADTDVPALSDDVIQVQNGHFILPQDQRLFAAYAGSPTIARARIVSPTLRQIANPFIRPISAAALPPANPNMYLFAPQGMSLRAFEETQILGTAAPGTTERFTAHLWIGDSIAPWPQGNLYPLRFTSATAAVANSWTTLTIAFTDVIPAGIYTVVFSEHFSTNAQAHRWIFSNQVPRPGLLSYAANTSRHPNKLLDGYLGVMGYFRSNDLPRFQALCNAADATHEGYLWCIRSGNLAA